MTAEERVKEFEKICQLTHPQRDVLVRMFTAAIEEEREACAIIVEENRFREPGEVADMIRARGEKA